MIKLINKNKKLYNFISLKCLKILIKKYLFIKKKINLIFVNLLDIFIINKYYKYSNNPTNILIFNNYHSLYNSSFKSSSDIYLCNIIIESESIIFEKKLFYVYVYITIHWILHCQNFKHKNIFLKKNIFNYLEFKFLNNVGFKKI
ncbi:hypothetical protein CA212_111 [Candidatus Nasuia deltocephalinicola]|nr:hypothetical protein CA212_111 [Candidatus Nasuia deltocephalinicola]